MGDEGIGARSETQAGGTPPSLDAATTTPIWISQRLRIVLVAGAILLLGWAIWRVPSILTIVLGGVVLALVLSFPVRWLARAMPRGLAILATLLLLLGGIVLAFVILVPLLIGQLTSLIAAWPSIMDSLGRMLDDLAAPLRERGVLPQTDATLADRLREGLSARSQQIVQNLLRGLLNVASGAISFLIQLFGILFIAVYLLADVRTVRRAYLGLMPDRYRVDADALWDSFSASFSRYLGGVFLMAAIEGGLSALGLSLLGVPYALLLGLLVAVTSVIPYLGAWLSAVPAVLIALTQSPTTAVLTVLLYVIIQQVESNILTPQIQGEATHVHPIIVLVTVIWAGQAFGLLGSVFAVPALVVVSVLADFFRARLRVRDDRASAQT